MGAVLPNRMRDEFVWVDREAAPAVEPVVQQATRVVVREIRDRCEVCWTRFRNTFFVLSSFGFSAACIAESIQLSSTEGKIVAWVIAGVFIFLPFCIAYRRRNGH